MGHRTIPANRALNLFSCPGITANRASSFPIGILLSITHNSFFQIVPIPASTQTLTQKRKATERTKNHQTSKPSHFPNLPCSWPSLQLPPVLPPPVTSPVPLPLFFVYSGAPGEGATNRKASVLWLFVLSPYKINTTGSSFNRWFRSQISSDRPGRCSPRFEFVQRHLRNFSGSIIDVAAIF